MHTNAPHWISCGCERMLEHSAHSSSYNINWLFMLAKRCHERELLEEAQSYLDELLLN